MAGWTVRPDHTGLVFEIAADGFSITWCGCWWGRWTSGWTPPLADMTRLLARDPGVRTIPPPLPKDLLRGRRLPDRRVRLMRGSRCLPCCRAEGAAEPKTDRAVGPGATGPRKLRAVHLSTHRGGGRRQPRLPAVVSVTVTSRAGE